MEGIKNLVKIIAMLIVAFLFLYISHFVFAFLLIGFLIIGMYETITGKKTGLF